MRYIVISTDTDEQQMMIDYVTADSHERAVEIVLDGVRDYCQVAEAFTSDELHEIADLATSETD